MLFGVFNPTLLRFDSGKVGFFFQLKNAQFSWFLGGFEFSFICRIFCLQVWEDFHFIVTNVCSTLYTFTWDVTMDWSIGRPKHAFLRKDRFCFVGMNHFFDFFCVHRMFMSKSVYYLAIVADFILRFLWLKKMIAIFQFFVYFWLF